MRSCLVDRLVGPRKRAVPGKNVLALDKLEHASPTSRVRAWSARHSDRAVAAMGTLIQKARALGLDQIPAYRLIQRGISPFSFAGL